jgi:hypothetical protein
VPFVEGRSLRDRLAATSPADWRRRESRDVLVLAYAHAQGVVIVTSNPERAPVGWHRGGHRFGIAKALTAARRWRSRDVTAGSGIGIRRIARAGPDPTVDHRADIYAFGCRYEVFTGNRRCGDAPLCVAAFQDTPRR